MTYTVPNGVVVDFELNPGYTVPSGDVLDFEMGTVGPVPSPLPAIKGMVAMRFDCTKSQEFDHRITTPYDVNTPHKDVPYETPWDINIPHKDTKVEHPWTHIPAKDSRLNTPWEIVTPSDNGILCKWNIIPAKDVKLEAKYEMGTPTDTGSESVWEHLVATPNNRHQAKDVKRVQVWANTDVYFKKGKNDFTIYVPPRWPTTDFDLSNTSYETTDDQADFELSNYINEILDLGIAPKDSRSNLPFKLLSLPRRHDQAIDNDVVLRWGPGGSNWARDGVPKITPWGAEDNPPGSGGDPLIIPIQQVYIVIHNITVIRQSDSFEIDAESVNLSLNTESWAWGFSAVLLGKDALDAVMPSAQGEPVILEVSINGTTWQVMVEDWVENREFGKRSVSVKGRGISAELASPYELPGSGVETSARTIQQLMDERLPLGSGWSLVWHPGLQDWLIPAGAYSWQDKSPIGAIYDIASSVGMVVVPNTNSRTLAIQPRYTIMPWDFAGASPDVVIPDAAILTLQRQQAIQTQANAVYVHGDETGGIAARVYLDGSAGDKLASTHNSKLITHTDGAIVCGSRFLAKHYQQPEVRAVTMTMGGAVPLGEIGQLLQIDVGVDTHRGIVNSVALGATRSTVRQTLSIGEKSPNKWSQFKRLTAGSPLLMGEIATDHGDGTLTVTLMNSGSIRVKGSGTVGDSVWVRNHRIEGSAPDLTTTDIPV